MFLEKSITPHGLYFRKNCFSLTRKIVDFNPTTVKGAGEKGSGSWSSAKADSYKEDSIIPSTVFNIISYSISFLLIHPIHLLNFLSN